ncbi:MAG: hypothetical protein HKN16_08675 [Saprospiraceae bacterium]|nr:hypothetical protein [Saprospiraceae bacterium]
MIFRFPLILVILLFSGFSQAQVADDIIRYSRLETFSTARSAGVGGGLSALGTDFAMIGVNPGGLGNYRKSEFVLSPGLNLDNTESDVLNDNEGIESNSKVKFGFRNLGFVFNRKPRGNKWKTYNVAIGFNQVANYHREFSFAGRTQGSVVDRFLELAYDGGQAISPEQLDDFEAGLAYETGALFDPDSSDGPDYFNDFEEGPTVYKMQQVTTKGNINELLIAFAGNYNDKLSIGASFGVPIVNYTYKKIYNEEDDGPGKEGDIAFFNALKFNEDLNTSGVGFNAKIGATYRVTQAFRFGIAVHSPTWMRLTDLYYNKLRYNFTGSNGLDVEEEASSPDGTFDYGLTTPWRAIGSAAFIVGKKGFVTGEVEYLDYSTAKFNFTRNSSSSGDASYEREVNDEILNDFGSAVNLRLGGEIVLSDWRARAGIGLIGKPKIDDDSIDLHYSVGFGYRGNGFYFDMAYRLFQYQQEYRPYNLVDDDLEPLVEVEGLNNQILTTVGFRF